MSPGLYYTAVKGHVERGNIPEAIEMMREDWRSRGQKLSDAAIYRFLIQKGVPFKTINQALGGIEDAPDC